MPLKSAAAKGKAFVRDAPSSLLISEKQAALARQSSFELKFERRVIKTFDNKEDDLILQYDQFLRAECAKKNINAEDFLSAYDQFTTRITAIHSLRNKNAERHRRIKRAFDGARVINHYIIAYVAFQKTIANIARERKFTKLNVTTLLLKSLIARLSLSLALFQGSTSSFANKAPNAKLVASIMSTLRKSIDASSFAAFELEVQRDPFENQLLLALLVKKRDSFEYELAKAMSNRCLRLVEIKDFIIAAELTKKAISQIRKLLKDEFSNNAILRLFDRRSQLFSAFKKGFAIVLDAEAKTYEVKSFFKSKSRRADDLIDADKLKDFKKSLRPIKLSFNDSDLSVEITLESAKSTREPRFTSQIDDLEASSSQPESLDRAFDKVIKALADLLKDEDDLTSSSGPYSGLANSPSAKFTLINDATNKRKNDTRSFTLKDTAAGTSSSNAGLAKRRRPSQPKENEGVEDVNTERDYKEAAEA
ncbi:hypothetical protein MBM_06895 [Drepanopeziza brunnea f. sp. 'multigermtubi' MB_m1]|uniref:Uncharacterized protein n=1 Tax=Marssonina brunnea f. sp. multigermtubi (strain MB_m1) TaxID=1072389 RepID=K1XRD2_MARBU|nr:uncharacterized protein MBM_06895 [Drepanopeziza brunnea f. sp. 'multigermtubi' MB_m1]EKD15134.1 hypothetical protein MBM_06895 [Drepanopeziza brunnea f. sp. 'multigermtubi' MB_m1]